jgi:hypothetical protein
MPWVPGQRKKHGEGKSAIIGEMYGVAPKTVRDIWNHRTVSITAHTVRGFVEKYFFVDSWLTSATVECSDETLVGF